MLTAGRNLRLDSPSVSPLESFSGGDGGHRVRIGSTLPLSIWIAEEGAFVARKPRSFCVVLQSLLGSKCCGINEFETGSYFAAAVLRELVRGIASYEIAYSVSCT